MPRLATHDPLASVLASRAEINARRDEIEASPISVPGFSAKLDVDEKADARLREAIALWDDLGSGTVDWTMADNSVVTLTKSELEAMYHDARVARAIRGQQLHQRAWVFKNDPTTTLRDIEPENW